MARKNSKAELEARRQELQAMAEAHEFAQYPSRLMAALERATDNNFELEVRNCRFEVRDRDASKSETFLLTMTHTRESQEALQELEYNLETKEELRAEELKRYTLKKSALAKLTAEEKEALDL